MYFAAWLSMAKDKVKSFKFGLLPLAVLSGLAGNIASSSARYRYVSYAFARWCSMFIVAAEDSAMCLFLGLVGILGAIGSYLCDRISKSASWRL